MAQCIPFGGDISDDLDPAVGHLLHVAVELLEESVLNGSPVRRNASRREIGPG